MRKNKTKQRLTAMVLSVIMVVGMMPVSVLAETGTSEADLKLPSTLSPWAVRGTFTLLPTGREEPETVQGLGTEEDPLRIETAAQLAAFAWSVNHGSLPTSLPDHPYLILVNDLNLSDYDDEDYYGKGWMPIGGYYNENEERYAFHGIFDGNNKTIRGLYIDRDTFVGLFGLIHGGTVKNLTVEDGAVTGSSCTGGIVGFFDNGRVENCNFSGSVSGELWTGGIVGDLNNARMEDCKNKGSIRGKVFTGGIAGIAVITGDSSEDGSIENCVNTGEVIGSEAFTGGITGSLTGMSADYCVNTGTVKGGTGINTGGVAGDVLEGIIQNCVNSGEVSSNANNIGGVAGLVGTGTIQNCVNYANISSNANSVGGVAGFVKDGSVVTNCLTTGNISGNVTEIESGGVSGVVGRLNNGNNYSNRNTISGCVGLGQSVTKDGEMGSVARIATVEPYDMAYENFAWSGMQLWYDDELISEEEYSLGDGENADAATLQTLWTAGALAESWSDAGVWTLGQGKLPVLTSLPHQSDKFPSHIPMATVGPASKTFPAATAGYKQQTAQQFTIENTGTAAISGLSAALTDGTKFEISTTLSDTIIASGSTATVSVRPKTGLSVGAYTDTLRISGDNEISLTVNLSFAVNNSSGGSSDNGGSSGGDTPPVSIAPEKKPLQPIMTTTPITAIAGANGTARAAISDKTIADAIAKAQADAKAQGKTANGISIGLNVTMPQGATALTVTLTPSSLSSLVNAGVASLEINGSSVKVAFDLKALQEIQKQSSGDVTIAIKPAQNLSSAAKKLIGTRPVHDITVSYVKDGKTTVASAFNGGIATISIPYKPGKNEAVGYLYGVYVDATGDPTRIAGSAYDSNSGCVVFTITHFSLYGIGYTAPSAKFTDIANHWGKESIDYVVGRGLLSGTTDTTFAPNTAMTRGMLVTALGRLASVDAKAYTTNSFADLKADSVFRPYIEWAYKKGIIQGIGNQQFAPRRAITREEIAAIFANFAKTTGYKLPVTRTAAAFADASSIGSAYKDVVTAMQQAGIMVGEQNNKFNPKTNATRAEVAAMLHRYIKLTIDPATAQGWALNDDGQYMYYKDGGKRHYLIPDNW